MERRAEAQRAATEERSAAVVGKMKIEIAEFEVSGNSRSPEKPCPGRAMEGHPRVLALAQTLVGF